VLAPEPYDACDGNCASGLNDVGSTGVGSCVCGGQLLLSVEPEVEGQLSAVATFGPALSDALFAFPPARFAPLPPAPRPGERFFPLRGCVSSLEVEEPWLAGLEPSPGPGLPGWTVAGAMGGRPECFRTSPCKKRAYSRGECVSSIALASKASAKRFTRLRMLWRCSESTMAENSGRRSYGARMNRRIESARVQPPTRDRASESEAGRRLEKEWEEDEKKRTLNKKPLANAPNTL